MEDFKGTTGPYVAELDAVNSIVIESSFGGYVCEVIADNDDDLIEEKEWANARLLSASYEMLEALQSILKIPEIDQDSLEAKKAVEAINKALGRL